MLFRSAMWRAPAGAGFLALGRRHSCTTPWSPSRARAMHRATRRLTGSGKGSVICCWPRRRRRSQGAPRKPTNILRPPQSSGAKRAWRFAVNPERPDGVRGQNRNLSLISVAERNQHRHSMTPGRLAAVKDRGCPPILACCGYRLASKNRLPPAPARAAAARARRRP